VTKTSIYLFPGQGSDRRIFEALAFDKEYEIKPIEYGTPDKGQTMASFALSLVGKINTSQKFILVGMSLGGMICVELNEILSPLKTIIISSAKNRNELPLRYRFQKTLPLYNLFPGKVLFAGAKFLQPIVEPDRNKNKETFISMLSAKDPVYMKRAIGLIINWERTTNNKPVYHIHGSHDRTIPLRNIKPPVFVVDHGSHMITLTRASEISAILKQILLG